MEREIFVPSELTGQVQNTYSNGMSESGGDMPKPTEPQPGGDVIKDRVRPPVDFSGSNIADPDTRFVLRLISEANAVSPQDRQAAQEKLAEAQGMDLIESQRRIDEIRGQLPAEGNAGVTARLDEAPPDDERNGAPVEPAATPETPRAHALESPEEKRLREEEPMATPLRIPDEEDPELSDEGKKARDEKVEEIAKETPPEQVLNWIVNPVARDEHFNEIYAIVDSRPYDFWQTAFDQINDGAKEHYFNETLNRAFQDRWGQIETGRRGEFAGITIDEVKQALAKRRGVDVEKITDKDIDDLRAEIKADFYRFQREREVRRTLHDVNAVIYIPGVKAEELFGQMQRFDSASGDIALSMPGVRDMMNVYESVLREIMAENNGWLPSDQVLGKDNNRIVMGDDGKPRKLPQFSVAEAERRTKERYRKLADAGLLVTRAKSVDPDAPKDQQIWEMGIRGGDDLKDWDIDRIFTISRGMMIMEERLISLAAESKLPANDIRYASGFLQDVIQQTSIYAHMVTKWGITQEAMAAYLYEGKNEEMSRFFGTWDPNRLKEAFARYQENPEELFESLDHMFYLGRRNPNRAGDIYTWISWRGVEKPDVPSMMQDFLLSGRARMKDRLEDPETRARFERNKPQLVAAWKRAHPHEKVVPSTLEELLTDEYQNWSGTGFRFEKLRGNLAKFNSHGKKDHHDFEEAFNKAQLLMGRMVDLQPHRVYGVSRWVRERVSGKNLTKEQQQAISRDLENLSIVEAAFLNSREYLLENGITFDTADLNAKVWKNKDGKLVDAYEYAIREVKDKDGNVLLTAEEQIASAKELARKIKEDFVKEGKKPNKENNYWKEFVYKREYTHGYVLWSGDTPADEYNFSALGATGGFVRRARDNDNQTKAATAEVGLIDGLKDITEPEQLYEAMEEIWKNIDHYDRTKAQQAMMEKLVGILRVYKADSITKVPLLGFAVKNLRGGKLSYARMMYGPEALALESSDLHKIINHFEHKKRITVEQGHELMRLLGATDEHLAYEFGVAGGQLMLFAILLQLLSTSINEIGGAAKEG